MGFSTTITEIILLIASVVLASGVSAQAIYTGISLQSNILQTMDYAKRDLNIRISIGYATINETVTPKYFIIYAKNTGLMPITDFSTIDVYVGEYGRVILCTYSSDATIGSGSFSLTTVDGDGIWEIGETAIIKAYPSTDINASIYEVKIVPFRGIPSSYLFPPPP
ncbi:MAG: flagellin [archaeon GB-1867-005]|nr:flagellin [Candidatus Culexmicrobium cathedralense]